MSAQDHLNSIQFMHVPDTNFDDEHSIEARHEGKKIGALEWAGPEGHKNQGVISWVEVNHDYQRQGIATEMLRRARQITPDLEHSGEYLDEQGERWADARP